MKQININERMCVVETIHNAAVDNAHWRGHKSERRNKNGEREGEERRGEKVLRTTFSDLDWKLRVSRVSMC